MKKIFLAVLLPLLLLFSFCSAQATVTSSNVKGDLKISMLNIGHGDSIVIQTKKQTILIDTGKHDEHTRFVRELEKLSVTKIDKIILTHPHVDHIGGAKMLIKPTEKELAAYPYLKKISVAEVYDNGTAYTSGAYRSLMKTIKDTGIPYRSLKVNDELDFGGGVKFKVFWPTSEFVAEMNAGKSADKKDRQYGMNNSSIVGKLTYKKFSMMFTGDCEKESEAKILKSCAAEDLKCDVLKSGHHGISTSSTKNFVAAVNPSVVLISAVGATNIEMFKAPPHLKVIETYLAAGVDGKNIFSTHANGTITITTNGKKFSVQPEVKAAWLDEWLTAKKDSIAKRKKG